MSFFVYGLRLRDEIEYRYVGLTSTTPEDRLYRHIKDAKRTRKPGVQTWINKHMPHVCVDTLEVCATQEEVNAAEVKWIMLLRERDYRLLNLTTGGEGTSGYARSTTSNEKASASLRGRKASDEARQRMSAAAKQRDVPHEVRAKIAAAVPRGVSHWTYGQPRDEETRKKISNSLREFNKANPRPKQAKDRMSKEEQLARFYANRALGTHTRWHRNRGIVNPDCEHCTNEQQKT